MTAFRVSILILLIGLPAYFGWRTVVRSSFVDVHLRICQLVDDRLYMESPEVSDWLNVCRKEAGRLSGVYDSRSFAARMNSLLAGLGVSHLFVYTPEENLRTWHHAGRDTGLRVRRIEDKLVVARVLPGSSAQQVGVQAGDIVLGVDGMELRSSDEAVSTTGLYTFERLGRQLQLRIEAADLQEEMDPTYEAVDRETGYLRLPSFLGEHIEAEKWRKLAETFGDRKHLILDLRSNSGGNFSAMLRAWSVFACGEGVVGSLIQPRRRDVSGVESLKDDNSARSQIEQLDRSARVDLAAYDGYPCFRGRVTVLIDSGTSSVSEIFASAFYSRPQSRVWGWPSPGNVVVARWFGLEELGPNYSISIPIAGYRSNDGTEIENQGLYPQQILHYQLEDARKGLDTWLMKARSWQPLRMGPNNEP